MKLRRIGTTARPSSTGRSGSARPAEQTRDVVPVQAPARARLRDDRAPQSFRPAAGFVAQYVDQHYPWPRSLMRKEGKRLYATCAYIDADMLPDLLAETLRLRTVDRKF